MSDRYRAEVMNSRYLAAAHAMQSGVAMEMTHDPKSGTPKDLRVGVNSAMVDHAALVRVLIAKGIFTTEEYELAVTEEMEREVQRYEDRLNDRFGTGGRITLK
jgi:hypothetical protein